MSDAATRFHEDWLGRVQPVEGLVVSIPILVDAQCDARQNAEFHRRFVELVSPPPDSRQKGKKPSDDELAVRDLDAFLAEVLELQPEYFHRGDQIPADLHYYAPEGHQDVRPTLALRRQTGDAEVPTDADPSARAAAPYVALFWDLPEGLDLDKPETETGPWRYPPVRKFIRLLGRARVPIGVVTNRRVFRLVYAPYGESVGWIDFHVAHMARFDGRPILDALVMLLSLQRFFGAAAEHQLPALLAESRKRQANVTNKLAEQVFGAMEDLLRGFEAAAERDASLLFDEAVRREDDHVYGGLLTVLLRLVFLLYAEDKDLLPTSDELYAEHYSVFGLFEELQADYGAYPDSMDRRFGAWARLVSLFRGVHYGARHGGFVLPPRRGQLFDPDAYPFLEGRAPGGSAPVQASDTAAVRLPSVDDLTVYRVLHKLVVFEGQRLSYSTLDVEQIGSVYEALMGYHVVRVFSDAVCLRPSRAWLEARTVLDVPAARRAKWIQETTGLAKAQAKALAAALKDAGTEDDAAAVLEGFRVKGTERARAGRLVVQPGAERRRTSSHYTPRSLSAPIVERTLEPLLKTMGEAPPAERILRLKVCDPAMGSGAFLVEACRYLADQVVAAWTRDGELDAVVREHGDDVWNHARRLVAQRCLYGVDKNPYAVNLAKLSLWLVTMARDLPFTFLDHALRCGDSLVGLDFEQIRSFHWKPEAQNVLCSKALDEALDEAIGLRQRILELAESDDPEDHREKERLLDDAEDAVSRVRLIGDLIVGAFFAGKNGRERKAELGRRLALVNEWLERDEAATDVLKGMQDEIRERFPMFHWMLEFPEAFYSERRDPLDGDAVNRAAYIDAVIGNPPFLGGRRISTEHGDEYADWLAMINRHGKNGDLSAHFFRLADRTIGVHGVTGLIATNTIAQGDTRQTGLQALLANGHIIYDTTRSLSWPGDAAVVVSVVHTAKGSPSGYVEVRLDGKVVISINSRLRPKPERTSPDQLSANHDLSYQGSILVGMGFTLDPGMRADLISSDPRNATQIFPYIGGEEVNSNADQGYHRFAISFGDMDLSSAAKWPDLLDIVRQRVKPERDRVKRQAHRKYWWHYGDKRPTLYKAISAMDRCIVHSRHSKHLAFVFQPTDRIFAESLFIYAISQLSAFSVLQARIHEVWARLHGSSIKSDLRYSTRDCFETFPFPRSDPRAEIPILEALGQRLYEARAAYMLETQQGLTKTYNHLKDPTCTETPIVELRRLHEEMDHAVLEAYGWDVEVPPYESPVTEGERRRLEAFEDEVIDRLFVLNAERAAEERALGLGTGKKKSGKKGRKKKGVHEGQAGLFSTLPSKKTTAAPPPSKDDAPYVVAGEDAEESVEEADPRRLVLSWFEDHPGWHARSDVLADVGLSIVEWNQVIGELVASGEVERTGEKRGTRYRWREHEEPSLF